MCTHTYTHPECVQKRLTRTFDNRLNLLTTSLLLVLWGFNFLWHLIIVRTDLRCIEDALLMFLSRSVEGKQVEICLNFREEGI